MPAPSDIELAERLNRRRARFATASGTIFMLSLAGSFHENATSRPGAVELTAWTIWALVLIAFLAWGSGLIRRRSVRELVDDEVTRAHRRDALVAGFWGAVAGTILIYLATLYQPVTAREALRGVVTLAVALALLRFGGLERRAMQTGEEG
jgi:hypothetical protein